MLKTQKEAGNYDSVGKCCIFERITKFMPNEILICELQGI